jgi:hypothetical protein
MDPFFGLVSTTSSAGSAGGEGKANSSTLSQSDSQKVSLTLGYLLGTLLVSATDLAQN